MSTTASSERKLRELHEVVSPRPGFFFRMEIWYTHPQRTRTERDKNGARVERTEWPVKHLSDEKAIEALELALKATGGDVRKALAEIEKAMKVKL